MRAWLLELPPSLSFNLLPHCIFVAPPCPAPPPLQMELQLAELVGELCEALPEASLAQLDALTAQAEAVEEQVAILKVWGRWRGF